MKKILSYTVAFMIIFNISFAVFSEDTALTTIKIEAETFLPGAEEGFHVTDGKNQPEVNDAAVGQVVGFQATEWMKYSFNVSRSADYKIIIATASSYAEESVAIRIDGEEIALKSYKASGEWGKYVLNEICITNISEGEHIIQIENNYLYGYNFDYFIIEELVPIIPIDFLFQAEKVTAGGTVKRATDTIEIKFNNDFKTAPNTQNVKIKNQNRDELPFLISTIDRKIIIQLQQSLDYETNYEIYLNGIEDKYSNRLDNYIFSFISSNKESDSGKEKIEIIEYKYENQTANLKGRVTTNEGVGISNRNVNLLKMMPDKSEVLSVSSVSSENGNFEFTYKIEDGSLSGIYLFFAKSDYLIADTLKYEAYYVNKADDALLVETLGKTAKTADVANYFKNNQTALGINTASDLLGVTSLKAVYDRFIGAKYLSAYEIRKDFFGVAAIEKINQAKDVVSLGKVLENEKNANYLNIDNKKLNYLPTVKQEVLKELFELENINDYNDFKGIYDAILDKWYRVEYQKSDLNLLDCNASVSIGQSVPLKTDFTKKQENVTKLTMNYRLKSQNTDIFKRYLVNNKWKNENSLSENVLTVKTENILSPDFGTVDFTIPNKEGEQYIFEVWGEIVYNISDVPYSITTKINLKEMILTLKSSSGSNGSDSSSRPSGGGVVKPTPTPKPEDKPILPKEKFKDLEEVSWAKESIMGLYEIGAVNGTSEGTFEPQRSVTREEFVKMICTAFGIETLDAKCDFADVSEEKWYAPYIASAVKSGVITGYSDNIFGIGEPITRQSAAVIVDRVLIKINPTLKSGNTELFFDDEDISSYAKKSIYRMKNIGVISGMGNNLFVPNEAVTRAAAAKIIHSALVKWK